MSLLDRAVAHYKSLPEQKIEVPEWGDEKGPAVIYFTVPTLAEVNKINLAAKGDPTEMSARLIVLKAKDEAGNALFQIGDHLRLLRECHPEIVGRISAEMTKQLVPPDPKESAKNSETISED